MQVRERSAQARREIDRKFSTADLASVRSRPHSGWIRAIRGALGMSQTALAGRLGVSGPAVAKLERAEVSGGITLAKLSDVAAALECTLVYALVPNTSLQDTVERQARRVAADRLGHVTATMALEDQSISDSRQDEYLERYAQELVGRNDLWNTSVSCVR
jgi:predicted DNA-binding mobile mystery protein A